MTHNGTARSMIVLMTCVCLAACNEETMTKPVCSFLRREKLNISRANLKSMTLEEKTAAAKRCFHDCVLTTESEPWAMLHGMLVYGAEMRLLDRKSSRNVPALSFLLDSRFRAKMGRSAPLFFRTESGIRPVRVDRWKTWEDHEGQVLALLLLAHVSPRTPVSISGEEAIFDVEDLFSDLSGRLDRCTCSDPSLAILAFVRHSPDKQDARGKQARLTYSLIEQSLSTKIQNWTCFGTHALYALAVSLREVDWERNAALRSRVESVLNDQAELAINSVDDRGICFGATANSGKAVASRMNDRIVFLNGHTMEWLCEYLPEERLGKEPLRSAISRLAEELALGCQTDFVDYGALCHAMYAIDLYEKKVLHSPTKKVGGESHRDSSQFSDMKR